ncbi:AMP-binding protein [Nocardioides carbamazepini]|uniref:class I adenylate-forming enzyme family protein n=1 Tax=Nocardioides carbamazepini TaxID=2854259 RepID=UPI00214A5EFA|nr:AMP-binding protein [Nocardioides carbamazepini]MCR1784922.1 AMP-binding protein [Nocardioides carbamazepini]
MYLTQSLHRRAQGMPDAPFTVSGDRVVSNRDAVDRISRIAGGLKEHGVAGDANVAVLDLNTDFFFLTSAAIAWTDAVIVPVNYRWSVKEIAYSLIDSAVEVMFVGDHHLPLVDDIMTAVPALNKVIHAGVAETPDGLIPLADLLASAPVEDAHRDGTQTLGIFYTGGTTGLPKGVVLSHRSVLTSATAAIAQAGCPRGGTALIAAPAFHMAGFCSWVLSLIQDQGAVPQAEFVPREVLASVEKYGVTQTTWVPTMIQMLVDHPEVGDFDLSSMEMIVYGASPISTALLDRAKAVFPNCRFTQNYGMTELSPTATVLRDEDHAHPEHRKSAGRPLLAVLLKIVDADDNEVPRGIVGEIVVKGDTVMTEYLNKPEETARALAGGWMHTGDSGFLDEDGYVHVVDRIKDMIISGGENVYSIEVEKVVAKYPGVVQCAVIGLPDDKWGERVHAVVQLADGASVTLEELREFCKAEIAGYKAPGSVEVVDAWPLSAAGKILKRELRAQRR